MPPCRPSLARGRYIARCLRSHLPDQAGVGGDKLEPFRFGKGDVNAVIGRVVERDGNPGSCFEVRAHRHHSQKNGDEPTSRSESSLRGPSPQDVRAFCDQLASMTRAVTVRRAPPAVESPRACAAGRVRACGTRPPNRRSPVRPHRKTVDAGSRGARLRPNGHAVTPAARGTKSSSRLRTLRLPGILPSPPVTWIWQLSASAALASTGQPLQALRR
jgi:hypothetical protein